MTRQQKHLWTTNNGSEKKALLAVLRGKVPWRRPVWMMRQAGRYLPEYRRLREKAGSFLNLCYTPELACEATLQPLRRFDLDAAIIFSDILVVAQALGAELSFRHGEGPVLSAVCGASSLDSLDVKNTKEHLSPIMETIRQVTARIPRHVTLIGFCGAPWTVASYMIEGGSSPDRLKSRLAACRGEEWFRSLINMLVEVSVDYLSAQLAAGVHVVQIFDSWAGDLPATQFARWCVEPVAQMTAMLRERHRDVPIIGFPRKVGIAYKHFAERTALSALSVDASVAPEWLCDQLLPNTVIQGNIDPVILLAGGAILDHSVDRLTAALPAERHICNLGHGVLPLTPIEHVNRMIARVRRNDGL